MKDILVPSDFSEEAINAVEYAAKLAQAMEASVTLLHLRTGSEESTGSLAQADDVMLEDTAAQVVREFEVPCTYVIRDKGNMSVPGAIALYAKEHDLVVMGTNGAESLVQEMIGTHTWRVSQKTLTPLIAVPSNVAFGTISHIVYAFEYIKDETLPMAPLIEFAKLMKAHIHLLHINSPYYIESTKEELEDYLLQAMAASGEEVTMSFTYAYDEDVAKGIDEYITKSNCNMLAVYSQHRNIVGAAFHRSISKQLARKASYPVYIFH